MTVVNHPKGFILTLAHDLITRYRQNRPISLDVSWEDDLIYPAYDGFSIANIPQTIGNILGVDYPTPLHPMLGIPTDVDRVVLYITDGLGYLRLQHLIEHDPEVADLVHQLTDGRGAIPLTSTTPSTTVVALNTLWTGATPAQHGVMGTSLFLPELAMMCNILYFKPKMGNLPNGILESWGIDPTHFTGVPTIAQRLAQNGVPTHICALYTLVGSGLSRMLHTGVEHITPNLGFDDMWGQFRNLLHQTRGQKTYVSMYNHNIDQISHFYHAISPQTSAEIKHQLRQLHQIVTDPEIADGRTLFLFIADHGHQDAPNFIHFNSPENFAFYDTFRMFFGGDVRFSYLYLRDGQRENAMQLSNQLFGENLALISSEMALEAGLFGTGERHPESKHRIGDLIGIPRPTYRLADTPRPEDKVFSLHAGLSAWEMLVPLLWKVI